jgi:KDO2-lipid IV(A) lauroyltransferase
MVMLVRILLILVGCLPLLLLHVSAWLLGNLLGLLPNKLRRLTRTHLQFCLQELSAVQRRRIGRLSLVHSMQAVMESPAIWFGPRWRLRGWLRNAEAEQQLKTLRASGKGVILLCPHIGSWELAGMFCAANGPMTSLYKPQKGVMDGLIHEGRTRLGAQLVPTAAIGVKSLLQALKKGEMIGILPDHDPPEGSGVFADFFGMPAHTTELVTKLAARTGAPVWFCLARRRDWGMGFEITLRAAPAEVADATQGVAALNCAIEEVIRQMPEQYWWGYERYRRRPPGVPSLYTKP